ncbi:LysR family transcriptional regulator [Asanoa iriomotensis]|uniref:HTH lysR-type domain-containing protein n=1 Tax=Asanoa iriomotensis TaxID=234613 RepID=A0ABQ4CBN1_9ACTN|nr:LysR family transcriptional regulator [Asanoa iriomotensis]GIF60188.1 hypothetical protein Air01nite_62830 [Asanoa iriomotensis]
MELRHLRTFVAVAEERSFSRAATRLRTAQSAVSRTVQALERELGNPLFARTNHHVELTKLGHATLDTARAALAAAEAVHAAARRTCSGSVCG